MIARWRTTTFGLGALLLGEVVGLVRAGHWVAFAAGFGIAALAIPATKWIHRGAQ